MHVVCCCQGEDRELDRGPSYKEPFIPIPGDEFGEPLRDCQDDFGTTFMNRHTDPFSLPDTETSALSSGSGDYNSELPRTSYEDLTGYRMGPVLQAMMEEWQRGDEVLSKKKKRKASRSSKNTSQEELTSSMYY